MNRLIPLVAVIAAAIVCMGLIGDPGDSDLPPPGENALVENISDITLKTVTADALDSRPAINRFIRSSDATVTTLAAAAMHVNAQHKTATNDVPPWSAFDTRQRMNLFETNFDRAELMHAFRIWQDNIGEVQVPMNNTPAAAKTASKTAIVHAEELGTRLDAYGAMSVPFG